MSKFRRRLIMTKKSLPYVPLEYIASSGTQYIDTGIDVDYQLKIKIKFLSNTKYGIPFGTYTNDWKIFNLQLYETKTSAYFSTKRVDFSEIMGQLSEIEMSCDGIYLNGELQGLFSDYLYFLPQYTLYLFCNNSLGSAINNLSGNIYSSKLYAFDVLVQNLVPCKDLNGVVCMYDKVSKQFFYNQGTGSFIAGPEI